MASVSDAALIMIFLLMIISPNFGRGDPVLFSFGDSNTDTGGNAAAYGSMATYPWGRIFPQPPSTRASDGRLIIDFFCENLSISYLKPYLDSLDPNFSNGVNFAISGSDTLTSGIHLGIQGWQFMRFRNRSIELHRTGCKGLVGEEGFKDAVYIFDIGQNDLAYALKNSSFYGEVVEQRIPAFILKIKKTIKLMYQLGGRRFWIHNTGPLGCLPWFVASEQNKGSGLDSKGCIKYLNDAAQEFNKRLCLLSEEMRDTLSNATVVYVDMYAIKYDLIANAASYGFENPFVACLRGNDVCSEGSKHISWDGIHYTEAANAIVASKIITGNYSTPPLPLLYFFSHANK